MRLEGRGMGIEVEEQGKRHLFLEYFFGILERNRRLSVEVVEDVSADIQRDDKESKEGKFDLYG